ncbi:hypothetical protein [Carnobacterium maltaromaticum]|uniref:hypothetical protein n=1 Tax=Carnobacterium maltaromaticum TaxID=2751 RepID=UPI0039AF59A0
MKIIYPTLVEQSCQFMEQQGIKAEKAEVYKMMVRDGMLTQTGEPTKKAIKQGLVTAFNQRHKNLKDFKREYSIFGNYGKDEFTQQDGIWYVSQKLLDEINQNLANGKYSYDEKLQVETYFNFRNYENPHKSISETKGVFHPLYTPYDDSEFCFADGKVAIPESIVEDIIYRADNGELDLDCEKLKQMLESAKE